MARPIRLEFSGALYHVTARGDRREAIYDADADREAFLETLAQVVADFNCVRHAYCLMTNHYHLVIETPDANLSQGHAPAQRIKGKWPDGRLRELLPALGRVWRSTPGDRIASGRRQGNRDGFAKRCLIARPGTGIQAWFPFARPIARSSLDA